MTDKTNPPASPKVPPLVNYATHKRDELARAITNELKEPILPEEFRALLRIPIEYQVDIEPFVYSHKENWKTTCLELLNGIVTLLKGTPHTT